MPAVWVSNYGANVKGENESNKVLAETKTIRVSV
jgi:hypothetical protein